MARSARTVVPGRVHHVWNTSPLAEGVVRDHVDAREFALAIKEVGEGAGVDVLGWRLRRAGFHLLLRPDDGAGLGMWMRALMTVTGARHRSRHAITGRLWPDRYRCVALLDGPALASLVLALRHAARAEGRDAWPWVRLPGLALALQPEPLLDDAVPFGPPERDG